MVKFFVFSAMFIISIPDIIWGLPNVLLGAMFHYLGKLMEYLGSGNMHKQVSQYGKNIAIGVDQFFNAKALGGDPDGTISGNLGRAKKRHSEGTAVVSDGWLMFAAFINFLFSSQKDHVEESIEWEEDLKDSVMKVHVSKEPESLGEEPDLD